MKTGVRLVAILLLGAAPQDPAEEKALKALIEQLDAEDLAQRERAREDLLQKGRSIAPVLKRYSESSSPEIVSQVRAILARFEWEENLERTLPPSRPVRIAPGTRAAEEVIAEVRRQAGVRVSPYAINLRAKVEVGGEDRPALQVLDDLCRRLGRGRVLAPSLGSRAEWGFRESSRSVGEVAIDGDKPPPAAVAHWNQFRAEVADVVVTEQRSLTKSSVDASLQLVAGALPGTKPVFVAPWEVVEATDDRGASLQVEAGRRVQFREGTPPDVGENPNSVWFTEDRWSSFGNSAGAVTIKTPSPGARRIAKLRVRLRVAFAVREVHPVLAIRDAKEKASLDVGGAVITVTKIEEKEEAFHLHYEVGGTFRGTPDFVPLDKDGRELNTGGGGSSSSGAQHQRYWYLRGGAKIAAVRTSAWLGHVAFDVPFEFTDIPLPEED